MTSKALWVTPARRAMLAGEFRHEGYKVALYRNPLPISTARYSAVGEIKAVGYRAGGVEVPSPSVHTDGDRAVLQFSGAAVWRGATIRARYGQIYNDYGTLIVFDLGEEVASTNDSFTVRLDKFALVI